MALGGATLLYNGVEIFEPDNRNLFTDGHLTVTVFLSEKQKAEHFAHIIGICINQQNVYSLKIHLKLLQ